MTPRRRINYLHIFSEKVENFLSSPKVFIISTLGAMLWFLPNLLIGYIVAQGDPAGPKLSDKAGYNIFDNFISDMGSLQYTPNTFFLDYGAMITAFLLIPIVYYIERKFAPLPRSLEEFQQTSRWRIRLVTFGNFFMIVGIIGLFGIGFFSEDRSAWFKDEYGIEGLHGTFSAIVFGGLVVGGLILGFFIIFYHNKFIHLIIRIPLGIWMMVVPLWCSINFLSYRYDLGIDPPVPPSVSYWEWMMLFSIMAWLIPLGFLSILEARRDIIRKRHH
ncbi:MAG: DUF998 domain-containing protein [Candidatus Hodarchaeota archaeon]